MKLVMVEKRVGGGWLWADFWVASFKGNQGSAFLF